MRYRSIQKCWEEIKMMDKDTAISSWMIRNLCKENKIHYILSGNKALVDFDSLLNYLNGIGG